MFSFTDPSGIVNATHRLNITKHSNDQNIEST